MLQLLIIDDKDGRTAPVVRPWLRTAELRGENWINNNNYSENFVKTKKNML